MRICASLVFGHLINSSQSRSRSSRSAKHRHKRGQQVTNQKTSVLCKMRANHTLKWKVEWKIDDIFYATNKRLSLPASQSLKVHVHAVKSTSPRLNQLLGVARAGGSRNGTRALEVGQYLGKYATAMVLAETPLSGSSLPKVLQYVQVLMQNVYTSYRW